MQWLCKSWYQLHPICWLLWPLSFIYRAIITLRRQGYKRGILNQKALPVPVIIVGNLTVGGTGKTPFVIWLVHQLKLAGFTPGIISRGYGGKAKVYPQVVRPESEPNIVGDEPIIISRHTACPTVVAPNRFNAGHYLLTHFQCDIIVCDDGLQHYALARDVEIAIVDGERGFGNQQCLPAGPLREPLSRLNNIDFIVHNGGTIPTNYRMVVEQGPAINLLDPQVKRALSDFNQYAVHAIAGIGHPMRFFNQLQQQGLKIIPHAFNDHHEFKNHDLNFNDSLPIIMTEKDAVKCQTFATKNMWYIPIEATINQDLASLILDKIAGITRHG